MIETPLAVAAKGTVAHARDAAAERLEDFAERLHDADVMPFVAGLAETAARRRRRWPRVLGIVAAIGTFTVIVAVVRRNMAERSRERDIFAGAPESFEEAVEAERDALAQHRPIVTPGA